MTWSLTPADFSNKIIGSRLLCLETTESTNLAARQLAEEGAPEGTTVLADSQSGGKGRLGRSWLSPPEVNFYGSVILRPQIRPQKAGQITFITSLAAARALRGSFAVPAEVKWPNDILVNGRKAGGVLNELGTSGEKITYLILGLGVNLNMTREQLPVRELFPATSIMLEKGTAVSRELFALNYLELLERLYLCYLKEGFSVLRNEWASFCGMIGRQVDLVADGRNVSGKVLGIDEEGALLLRCENGCEERFLSADIRSVRA
jgi:BirA family biotin operon repressor/biotin-[acetyl-CoA-carboxylase] ligase